MTDLNPFSYAAGEHRVRWVEASAVIDLLELTHAEERIELYRHQMADGTQFPPIAVLPLGRRLVLADGHKRLAAVRRLEIERIPVEVWGMSQLLEDQLRQLKKNAVKNYSIVRHLLTDPKRGWELFATTLTHWRRVLRNIGRSWRRQPPGERVRSRDTPDPGPRPESDADQNASKAAPTT